MSSSFYRVGGSLLALSLLGIGCSPSTGPTAPTSTTTPSSRVGSPAAVGTVESADSLILPSAPTGSASCDHPYYPLRRGYVVRYQTSGGGAPVSHYRSEVTDVRPGAATLKAYFDSGLEVGQTYACQPGGALLATAYVEMPTAGRRANLITRSSEGPYLPADFQVGSRWTQRFETLARTEAGSEEAKMPDLQMLITITHEAVAEESVTVPAGSYQAIKVRSVMKANVASADAPLVGDGSVFAQSTEWWVRGVGLVKTQADSPSASAMTVEAEAVTIP